MGLGAAIGGVAAGIYGANKQASAAADATDAQVKASNQQLALQKDIYNDTTARYAPIYNQGMDAQNALASMYGLADAPEGFTDYELSDDYKFRMDQGIRALDGSAAASGNLRSGAHEKALLEYGSGIASQGRQNWLSGLQNLSAAGQAAAGNTSAAGQNYASGAGQAYGNMGNALSAGSIAQGNAFSSGMNNVLSLGTAGYMAGQSALPNGITIGGSNSLFGGNSWG